MTRLCSICTRPDRIEIDTKLTTGTPLRAVAQAFKVGKSALDRHRHNCAGRHIALAHIDDDKLPEHRAPITMTPEAAAIIEPMHGAEDALLKYEKLMGVSLGLLRHAGARAIVKDDVPSQTRIARELRQHAVLDLSTAEERIRLAHAAVLDPVQQIWAKVIDPDFEAGALPTGMKPLRHLDDIDEVAFDDVPRFTARPRPKDRRTYRHRNDA
jgi:hypothetical protein